MIRLIMLMILREVWRTNYDRDNLILHVKEDSASLLQVSDNLQLNYGIDVFGDIAKLFDLC